MIANTRFLYEHIIIKFNCPLKLINNQGGHFINETIEILIAEIYDKPQESHNLLPLKEWSSKRHQQGVGGHFKEDNQLQRHRLGCKVADCFMGLSEFL
jgi:hypothetical protein